MRGAGWLEPFPDSLLDEGTTDAPLGPDVRYARTESISLAFVAALQVLPHRQVAVLILCDILGFEASEVASMLDATIDSVSSALKGARRNLEQKTPKGIEDRRAPAQDALVASLVRAYEAADLDALVALLTDDVFMAMPPIPYEYVGRAPVARFCALPFGGGRRFELVPTRANGQPAFGAYLRVPSGPRPGVGLIVLGLRGEGISAMTRFENGVLPRFGLPASLDASATDARVPLGGGERPSRS